MKAHLEPFMVYFGRYFFLILSTLILIFILVVIIMSTWIFCFTTVTRTHNKRRITVETAKRNAMIMKFMSCVPYSRFMLDEGKDCPICLEVFTDEDQVVQLKCNAQHIFHYKCMQQYLCYEDGPLMQKQCPLCRSNVQIQDEPVLEV